MKFYEVVVDIDYSQIKNQKHVFNVVKKQSKKIKAQFKEQSGNNNDYKNFIRILIFLLLQRINDTPIEIIKVFDEKNNVYYLLIEDIFKEKFYYIVYNLEQESIIPTNEKVIEILSGRGIPEDVHYLIEVARQTINKYYFIRIATIIISSIFLLIILSKLIPVILSHKKTLTQSTTQKSQQQRVYTPQELKSVKIKQWQEVIDKINSFIENASQSDGFIIDSIDVELGEVNTSTAEATYKVTIVKKYDYPEINTKKEGDYYIGIEQISGEVGFTSIISHESYSNEECLENLIKIFDISARDSNSVNFEKRTFEIDSKTGIKFFDFVLYLQQICGYNLSINSFGVDKDKNFYINEFTLKIE